MATKVTILGMDEPKKNGKGKIEFVKYINETKEQFIDASYNPCDFSDVEVLAEGFVRKDGIIFDLFFAHDGNRAMGCLYLGHFNDGIV